MNNTEVEEFHYCEKTIMLKNRLEGGFIELAGRLYEIKTKSLYRASWGSWEAFKDEFRMSDTTINALIQMYERFILEFHIPKEAIIPAGGFSMVQDILPVALTRELALSWLEKAALLTRADLRKELAEGKPIPCKHRDVFVETHTIEVCKHCGHRAFAASL